MKIELVPSESRKHSETYRTKKTRRLVKWTLKPADLSYVLTQVVGAFDVYFWDCDQAGAQTLARSDKRARPKSPTVDTIQMAPDTTALDMLLISLANPWLCERPNDLDIYRRPKGEQYEGPLVDFVQRLLDIHEVEYKRLTVGRDLRELMTRIDIKAKLAASAAERAQKLRDKKKAEYAANLAASELLKATRRDILAVQDEKQRQTFKPSKPFRRT